ncbi:type III-B CRISPR module RAMP protein Cmr1 [Herpetosiphon llansteffanensis]|uniref:type III-B CRISPR module RAMP protein Cmr1 n=1 Tax=Herpetosiphon llansteffanensis TaxID=2094568 RepID=UPI000D7D1722|nr:type III-B CRISPR module RAMP protein Cmr1 [Herpetosiphon llansteffanensis]
MNRKPTISAPDPIEYQAPSEFTVGAHTYITETRSYKLITPLFGGGVKAGVNDPITPIRASGIRGQLRFWWRAIRGGGYSTIDELRAKEAEIWGSASSNSDSIEYQHLLRSVQINVTEVIHSQNREGKYQITPYKVIPTNQDPNKFMPRFNQKTPIPVPEYATFPLQPTTDEAQEIGETGNYDQIKNLTHNIHFDLEITYHKCFELEILAALWAWEMFGGVGGRTRRGFGSITRIDGSEKPSSVESAEGWLKEKIDGYALKTSEWIEYVPNIVESFRNNQVFLSKEKSFDINIWISLIDKLKKFRHQRIQDGRKFGRNYWPEPDYIRRITKKRSFTHKKDIVTISKFPRATFGLPIIFHFGTNGDPDDTTLNPKDFERFSSPLIIKIIQCADKSYLGIVLVLSKTRVPNQLKLTQGTQELADPDNNTKTFQQRLTINEATQIKKIENNQAAGSLLNHQTDILEAFLAYLKEKMPKEK